MACCLALGRVTPGEHRHIDDFELGRELYRGKSSLLYKAVHKASGEAVAMKMYRKKRLTVLNK